MGIEAYLVICLAVILLGLSKGGFAGVGMLSTPLVALVTDPLTAVAIMLPIMIVQDLVVVGIYRDSFDRSMLLRLLPSAVLGVFTAITVAAVVPDGATELTVGVLAITFAGWQLAGGAKMISLKGRSAWDLLLATLAGFGSGFSSTIAHAGSPPFQAYALSKPMGKDTFVGTSVMFFAALNLMKLPGYATMHLLRPSTLLVSTLFIPLAVFASWSGAFLIRRIDAGAFVKTINVLLLLVGLLLAHRGLSALGYIGN